MSTILREFVRVSRRQRCPICDRADWCMIARDGSRALCQRVESKQHWRDAGWLHPITGQAALPVEHFEKPAPPSRTTREWFHLAGDFRSGVQPGLLAELAHGLGVSVASLNAMWIGWTGKAWSFPMSSADDEMTGIRLRGRDGRKFAVEGSRQGLFIPTGHLATRGPTLIVEGPTEAAAAIDLGFAVVGRPSCSACVSMLIDHLRLLAIRRGTPVDAVIVSNRDKPDQRGLRAGQRGTGRLLQAILAVRACRSVRVILPPRGTKDMRDWKRAGLTREELLSAIERAKRIECGRSQRLAIAT